MYDLLTSLIDKSVKLSVCFAGDGGQPAIKDAKIVSVQDDYVILFCEDFNYGVPFDNIAFVTYD